MLIRSLRVLTVLAVAAAALATGGSAGASTTASRIPAHVYAPYFETWTTDGLAATAKRSGARLLHAGLCRGDREASCTPAWDGDPSQPVAGGRYVRDIAALRRMGGDVVPSFGGYSADHGLTEIADSCTDVDRWSPRTAR